MSETKEVTPEFVQYIRERDAAIEDSKKAQAELRETQCKLYDAIQLIEKLEKKASESKSSQSKSSTTATKKPAAAATSNKKLTPKVNGSSSKASGSSSGRGSLVSSAETPTGLYHPPMVKLEPIADSRDYYWKIAESFPSLPLYTVIDAEKKFMKGDADNNGYIDMTELDKVLSDTVGMFTQKQLDEIMKEIDQDNSNTLDFYEVLTVINKLATRKKTNLPQLVQSNYTKTCSLQ